jgi:hypothetical protein
VYIYNSVIMLYKWRRYIHVPVIAIMIVIVLDHIKYIYV